MSGLSVEYVDWIRDKYPNILLKKGQKIVFMDVNLGVNPTKKQMADRLKKAIKASNIDEKESK